MQPTKQWLSYRVQSAKFRAAVGRYLSFTATDAALDDQELTSFVVTFHRYLGQQYSGDEIRLGDST